MFINELKAIYGDKYDFSDIEYVNDSTKIEFVCKEHGTFMRSPYECFIIRIVHYV